jgi:hypothetical protein
MLIGRRSGMKSTRALTVLCSRQVPVNRLNMHPNEGADIGLMMTKYSARMGEDALVELYLLNECPQESLEINARLWERLGKPSKVVLGYENGRLEIDPV